MDDAPLLQIHGLSLRYPSPRGSIAALRSVDLQLTPGECLALVGESGSGKTQMLLSILGLTGAGATLSGSIRYRGQELVGLAPERLNTIRGNRIGIVFQDPMAALNPYVRIGTQIGEVLRQHRGVDSRTAILRATQLLESLHVADAALRMRQYPHELSGGMRQRVTIAMAMIAEPEILLADEPSTALDVTVQAQVLALLRELRERNGTTIVLVTHDLGVTAQLADRVAVMYAGRIVEMAPVHELFSHPQHPYTEALRSSVARIDSVPPARLPSIDGAPPDPVALPSGCAFAPRCLYASTICRTTDPALTPGTAGHWKACHYEGALDKLRGHAA